MMNLVHLLLMVKNIIELIVNEINNSNSNNDEIGRGHIMITANRGSNGGNCQVNKIDNNKNLYKLNVGIGPINFKIYH